MADGSFETTNVWTGMPAFTLVPDKVSFAEEEDKTLAYFLFPLTCDGAVPFDLCPSPCSIIQSMIHRYWTKIKAFETSVERSVVLLYIYDTFVIPMISIA